MKTLQSLGVYCSASKRVDPIYVQAAKQTGQLVAKEGYKLVYGGGKLGLMGVVADSAMEAGGHVVGYIPTHLVAGEEAHRSISELHVVPDMHGRKISLYTNADAFIILPGGFGTLEEFFEVFVWKQIRLHSKPIVIVNINGFWDSLYGLMKNIVDQGFARDFVWDLATFVPTVADIPWALGQQLGKTYPATKWSD